MVNARPHVGVLMGGPSAEREVSLVSGRAAADALRALGHEVTEIDAGADLPARLVGVDLVFNALHGRWGEDGAVQGLLEWLRVPYTHSGVLASALAMDKRRAKAAFHAAGLPVARDVPVSRSALAEGHPLDPPYVLKPVNEGSSVGITLVTQERPVLGDGPELLMAEEFVPGRELTVAVLGGKALTVTDIITDQWYDYAAKYSDGGSTHILPADIPRDVFDAALRAAEIAHDCLGCRGLSRSDFRWNPEKGVAGLVILETNTQPGLTPTSLAPEQAELALGMSFEALMAWLVEDASCDR